MIKRIHVRYELEVEPGTDRSRIDRAFERHMQKCPVYRSIHRAIDITTALEVAEVPRSGQKASRR